MGPVSHPTLNNLARLTRTDYLLNLWTKSEDFDYDDLGNRTEVDLRDGTTDTYARNELTNRYDDDQGEDIVCEYDNSGNMTKDPNDYEYEYDYENRLIKITKNSGATTVAEFEYDALGRRIEKDDKIASEVTRYYHNNNWQVLCEKDDNGDTQRWFIYGNYIDEPLVMIDSDDDQHYYAHDHLFSTVALIDDQGNVLERYEYNAYGQPTIYNEALTQTYASSQYDNPYLFTGRRVDNFDSDSLRLQYNRNRYYDYYTGRWLSHDPLGITPNPQKPNRFAVHDQYKDGMNIYQYVQSRPFKEIDSYGLDIVSPWNPPVPETSNNYYSLYKPKKCGICGPDITEALKRLRQQIIQDFRKLSVKEQIAKCSGLWGGDSWDVTQLYDPGLLPNRGCATGDCAGTVQVGGSCHSSHAVNYYMYGTMHSLCSLFPEKTLRIGLLWPLLISGDASCKSKWAWAGLYDNDPGGIQCSSYNYCKTECKNKVGPLTYKWLSIPEMWKE